MQRVRHQGLRKRFKTRFMFYFFHLVWEKCIQEIFVHPIIRLVATSLLWNTVTVFGRHKTLNRQTRGNASKINSTVLVFFIFGWNFTQMQKFTNTQTRASLKLLVNNKSENTVINQFAVLMYFVNVYLVLGVKSELSTFIGVLTRKLT